MFKVGDIVYIDSNSNINWVDGATKFLRNNGPYTISEIYKEDQASIWQLPNKLFIYLSEIDFWVNKKCLIPGNSYNPIERKIAHLYKLFDERKK